MAELITVPSFVFHQENGETPIQVNYYNGNIELIQDQDAILLDPNSYEKLFKEIKKHRPQAQAFLDKQ